ncbi:MAG: hypothetical protein H7227_00075 [Actinobacteria bacterium]|nr:hypothetical protein [Actinomycetota bacterium]
MDTTGLNWTLDTLFRHMAWANANLLTTLQGRPKVSYHLSLPHDDWTVVAITEHLVRAAGGYAGALDGVPADDETNVPSATGDFTEMIARCAAFDERLRVASTFPEGRVTRIRDGVQVSRARSTVLAQSIHHATEHRAQIASILSLHQLPGIDLDELDLWAYRDAEGLGN